jgi:hypothetical protein
MQIRKFDRAQSREKRNEKESAVTKEWRYGELMDKH